MSELYTGHGTEKMSSTLSLQCCIRCQSMQTFKDRKMLWERWRELSASHNRCFCVIKQRKESFGGPSLHITTYTHPCPPQTIRQKKVMMNMQDSDFDDGGILTRFHIFGRLFYQLHDLACICTSQSGNKFWGTVPGRMCAGERELLEQ